MKQIITMLAAVLLALSLAGCANTQDTSDDEICPDKQPGVAGQALIQAKVFDPTEDMSLRTVDTTGNPVTQDVLQEPSMASGSFFGRQTTTKAATKKSSSFGRYLAATRPIACSKINDLISCIYNFNLTE